MSVLPGEGANFTLLHSNIVNYRYIWNPIIYYRSRNISANCTFKCCSIIYIYFFFCIWEKLAERFWVPEPEWTYGPRVRRCGLACRLWLTFPRPYHEHSHAETSEHSGGGRRRDFRLVLTKAWLIRLNENEKEGTAPLYFSFSFHWDFIIISFIGKVVSRIKSGLQYSASVAADFHSNHQEPHLIPFKLNFICIALSTTTTTKKMV